MWSGVDYEAAPPKEPPAQSQTMPMPEGVTSSESIDDAADQQSARGVAKDATYFPLGADPANVIAELSPLAQAGDMAAACRVALERLACEQVGRLGEAMLEQLRRDEHQALARAPRAGTPELSQLLQRRADRLATLQIHLIERQGACSRLPASLRSDGTDWLRSSALAGHPESILRYALGQSLGIIEGFEADAARRFDFLGHPGVALWQREAPALLNRMLADGRPEAAFLLFLAYSDDATPLNGLIRDDPVEAAVMRLVLNDFRQGSPSSDPLQGLDGNRRQMAIARHAALRQAMTGRAMDRRLLNQGTETPWLVLLPDSRSTAPPCQK